MKSLVRWEPAGIRRMFVEIFVEVSDLEEVYRFMPPQIAKPATIGSTSGRQGIVDTLTGPSGGDIFE